jgi:hypothetical protein
MQQSLPVVDESGRLPCGRRGMPVLAGSHLYFVQCIEALPSALGDLELANLKLAGATQTNRPTKARTEHGRFDRRELLRRRLLLRSGL